MTITETYVAMSQYCFGIGDTPNKAKDNLKKAGGNLKTFFIKRVRQFEGDTAVDVDAYGRIGYTYHSELNNDDGPNQITVVEAVKNGKHVDPAEVA